MHRKNYTVILGTRHTGIVVRDLERSIVFYRDLLGLQIWKRAMEEGDYIDKLVGLPEVSLEWVKLRAPDGSVLELLQYHSHPPDYEQENAASNRLGCSHVAFKVSDLEAVYRLLTDKGYHCNSMPLISPDGQVKVLYCHDPDGVILELVEQVIS